MALTAGPLWRYPFWQWPLWLTQALLAAARLPQPRLWARAAKAADRKHRLGKTHPLFRTTRAFGRERGGPKFMARQR